MKQKTASIARTKRRETMGDRVRKIADQLKEETKLQVKATSRILGAAAQIAENHERLIAEVVDMVDEDLARETHSTQTILYTVDYLKQEYKTLREAKTYLGLKANSWTALVNKLNVCAVQKPTQNYPSQASISERLSVIEKEIKNIHDSISQILPLLKQIILDKERKQ